MYKSVPAFQDSQALALLLYECFHGGGYYEVVPAEIGCALCVWAAGERYLYELPSE